MKQILSFFLILMIGVLSLSGQTEKKSLQHDDIESWKRITEKIVSNNGNYIVYKTEPWKGDSHLYLYDKEGNNKFDANCGGKAMLSFGSDFLFFRISPEKELLRELKLKKTKKDEMPSDILAIYDIEKNILDSIADIRSFKLPEKWSGYFAYQTDPADRKSDESETEEAEKEEKKEEKKKEESIKNGFTLYLMETGSTNEVKWPYVKEYFFAEEGRSLVFISGGNDDFEAGLYLYDCSEASLSLIHSGSDEYKQTIISKDGKKIAFLLKNDEEKKKSEFSLYFSENSEPAGQLLDNNSDGLPAKWRISENGRLRFSANDARLFFGTAPLREERDTSILDEDYPNVDIWHGSEGVLHTVQVVNRDRDMKHSFMAVYNMSEGKMKQIETPDVPDASLLNKGDSDYILLLSNKAYELQSMWESSPLHYDIYLMNLNTGVRNLIKQDIRAHVSGSPDGRYLIWYNYPDYSYYSYNISSGEEYRLTNPDMIITQNELNDSPNFAYPYGPAGWFENDEAFLIYDRFDIWKLDPENRKEPVNLTINGRILQTEYRLIMEDREENFIDDRAALFLSGHNIISRSSGYYSWTARKANEPVLIIGGNYYLSDPIKAKDSETVIYSMETFNDFPDLLVSDINFRKKVKISEANPQQSDFMWGSAELYKWTSLDGNEMEGLLYKPENFDPTKKYPMIVNFYSTASQELFRYKTPELHRSTIDYHYYTSNGYVIFNPDVHYRIGYPGESAYNCVIPGVTSLISDGFIAPDKIGAQGHSWGGYQVAYLATRSDIFACIESGAPVVNMFSAYGGIRWWTGLNRSFQYEHTQSRIGKTIWESPLRYIENSPLFTMDKVNTPILIMHNDQDGHVPWYQGIEYFIALRRLQKPVWMLNYTGEPHWPQKLKNKKDFQIRMSQFFNHYLKGEPMPRWMHEGVPAVNKDFDLGYELIEK